jgi:hypothetical protein
MCLFILYRVGLYGSDDAANLKTVARSRMIKAAELARQSQVVDGGVARSPLDLEAVGCAFGCWFCRW